MVSSLKAVQKVTLIMICTSLVSHLVFKADSYFRFLLESVNDLKRENNHALSTCLWYGSVNPG